MDLAASCYCSGDFYYSQLGGSYMINVDLSDVTNKKKINKGMLFTHKYTFM